jgi:hypothetical protein
MPNPIKLKRSAVAAAVPSSLEFGELAINYNAADGKLFYKNSAGVIVAFESGGGEDALLRSLFLPPAPTSVTATAGNAQVSLSWTAPTVLAQTPITDYVVQFKSATETVWTPFTDGTSTATSATVTGLVNGVAYQFQVAGVNAVGTGSFSTATSAVTPVAGDAYFSSVALLLHMDGSGSTFVDSSPTPKEITAVNATQSTTQSRWGGKSAYFDGSGDYLTAGSIPLGDSDFVIEGWFYLTSSPSSGTYTTLFSHRASASVAGGACLVMDGSSLLYFIAGTSGWQVPGSATGLSVSANTWMHIALVRNGNQCRAYLNGTGGSAVSVSGQIGTSGTFAIMAGAADGAQAVAGYCDDFRITVGSARTYTGTTVTVPTAAFPDRGPYEDPFMEQVSLLLHADGSGSTFVDSSLTPKTITAYGATQSTTQSKWGGKSAYFDGSSYLAGSGSGFSFGTGDFAVEFWLYYTGTLSQYSIFDTRSSSSGFVIYKASDDTLRIYAGSDIVNGGSLSANAWHHIAVARTSGTLRLYVDGSQAGSSYSSSENWTDANLTIGADFPRNGRFTQGYIDDLRITVGSSRSYTGSTITVPAAAFPDT